jgi:formate/nitrite transporter FocA (FNT family)
MNEDRGSNQGSNRGSSRPRHHSGQNRPRHQPRSNAQSSSSTAYEIVMNAGRRIVNVSHFSSFFKAFMAGGLIVIAIAFAAKLVPSVNDPHLRSFVIGIALSTGLFLVISSHAIVVTEANVLIPYNFYKLTVMQGFVRIFLFWTIAWIGNLLGALVFALLLSYIGILGEISSGLNGVINTVVAANFSDVLRLIVSGILANWIVAFAVMYSIYNRAAIGKILIMFVTLSLVAGLGLQYFPFNLAYFCLAKLSGHASGWLEIISMNLLPVTIGNLLGAIFFVAVPLALQIKRQA